jgi:hypothetical protein
VPDVINITAQIIPAMRIGKSLTIPHRVRDIDPAF